MDKVPDGLGTLYRSFKIGSNPIGTSKDIVFNL